MSRMERGEIGDEAERQMGRRGRGKTQARFRSHGAARTTEFLCERVEVEDETKKTKKQGGLGSEPVIKAKENQHALFFISVSSL